MHQQAVGGEGEEVLERGHADRRLDDEDAVLAPLLALARGGAGEARDQRLRVDAGDDREEAGLRPGRRHAVGRVQLQRPHPRREEDDGEHRDLPHRHARGEGRPLDRLVAHEGRQLRRGAGDPEHLLDYIILCYVILYHNSSITI